MIILQEERCRKLLRAGVALVTGHFCMERRHIIME